MAPFAVNGQLRWYAKPGRRRHFVRRAFDDFQPAGLVEIDRLQPIVCYGYGLPAYDVTGPELVFCLGTFADADQKLPFLVANDSLNPQRVPQVAVAALIE